MKSLLIMRHAKSSWSDESLSDHERPLNARGKRDAPRMGQLLLDEQLVPSMILSSTAKRAQKTAAKVAESCGYEGEIQHAERLYPGSPDDVLALLRELAADQARVLVVGHNPGLEELLAALTGQHEPLPTAAVAHVVLPVDVWTDLPQIPHGELVRLWRPRELP